MCAHVINTQQHMHDRRNIIATRTSAGSLSNNANARRAMRVACASIDF
jgi:hypothetical protein